MPLSKLMQKEVKRDKLTKARDEAWKKYDKECATQNRIYTKTVKVEFEAWKKAKELAKIKYDKAIYPYEMALEKKREEAQKVFNKALLKYDKAYAEVQKELDKLYLESSY